MNSIFVFKIIVLSIFISYPITTSALYCDDVKEWGFHCENCMSMVNCIQLPTGNWETISTGTCDKTKNEYCNEKEQKCSTEPDCPMEQRKFECKVEGTFPDPYDCGKYHICTIESEKFKILDIQCKDHEYSYSTKTKECSLKRATNKFCKNRQFICKKPGYMAPWPENSQFFYICVEDTIGTEKILYPQLYLCKYGEHFNGKQCSKKNIIPTTTSFPQTGQPIVGSCKKEGLFKNPKDCKKYFVCTKNLVKKQLTCPKNTHFDAKIKACVIGANC